MRTLTRSILAATAVVGLLALPVAGAGAEEQVVTGQVGSTVTIDSAPADQDLGTLPVTGASIGSITVNANNAYTLTAVSDNDTMTLWDGSAYDTSTSLASSMTVFSVPSAGGGTGLPGGGAFSSTTPAVLGTNAVSALIPTTDTYDLTVNQPATALDTAGDYRMVVTYTAALGI